MKVRKTKDLKKVLQKKGFVLDPEIDHHHFFILTIDGKKQAIKTYFSHGKKEYGATLMGQIKKQLRFKDSKIAEDFFDCPLSKEGYIEMLKKNGEV